jgi:bifunctional DNase/RNase
MGTRGRIGLIALLLVVGGSAGAAPDRADVTPPRPTGPQEVEVVGVLVDQRTHQPTIVLQGKRDRRNVAMTIGLAEATSIVAPLQGITPPRPLTHDLFVTLFGRLNVAVTRVVVTDLRDDIYYARVDLRANGTDLTLDSRPSDAIALAIRAKAPVLVEDQVFDKAGRGPERRRPHI